MGELTFLVIRVAFLLLMWFFILGVLYALKSDLFGAPVRRGKRAKARDPLIAAPLVAEAPVLSEPVAHEPVAQTPAVQAPIITPEGPSASPIIAPILPSASESTREAAKLLVITDGVAAGTAINLDETSITIGRSPDSSLVIVDEYTSTHHAKLQLTGDDWTITDLDSTNGTEVNGEQIDGTVPLPVFTPVKIGTTTFELRP